MIFMQCMKVYQKMMRFHFDMDAKLKLYFYKMKGVHYENKQRRS